MKLEYLNQMDRYAIQMWYDNNQWTLFIPGWEDETGRMFEGSGEFLDEALRNLAVKLLSWKLEKVQSSRITI